MNSCGAAAEAASTRTNDKWKRTKWKESQWDQQGNEIGLGKWLCECTGLQWPHCLCPVPGSHLWFSWSCSASDEISHVCLRCFFSSLHPVLWVNSETLMIASVVGGIITVSAPLPPHDCFGHNVFLWWPPTLPSLAAILNSSSILEYLTASAQPHRFGMESCC